VTARTSRKPLSRERVLAAAVALVDAHGVPALTMRRLAADLQVEAMSLYYHLPDKEALLDGVVETVLAEIISAVDHAAPEGALHGSAEEGLHGGRGGSLHGGPDGDAEGSLHSDAAGSLHAYAEGGDVAWQGRLRRQFLTAREVMLRHPWAPGLLASRRTVPASVYAYYDGILATLTGAGFSYHLAHRALHAFGSLPLGFAQEIFSPAAAGGSVEVEVSEEDMAAMADAFPHLAAMVAAEVHAAGDPTLGWCDSQVEFEFTLDLLLNGLARLRGPGSAAVGD
jgi:AcrR family transcriptional regulator